MNGVLVFSSCTAGKDDSIPIGERRVEPSDYISDPRLLRKLLETRDGILSRPAAKRGGRETYAFDLYVRKGRMYKGVLDGYYQPLKRALLKETIPVQWFFLSGGYGVISALESARNYQATFNYQIARRNGIPYTGRLWQPSLTEICGHLIARHSGWKVFVFGSQGYTEFLKDVPRVREIKIIESTGSAGPTRLAPLVAAFVDALLNDRLGAFEGAFPGRFTKLAK